MTKSSKNKACKNFRPADQQTHIDWSIYGALVRNRRIKLGYRKAEEFTNAVYNRTRIRITRNAIYEIEQGNQRPTVDQFISINAVLYSNPLPDEIVNTCFEKQFIDFCINGEIPNEYKIENYNTARRFMHFHELIKPNELPSVDRVAMFSHDTVSAFTIDEDRIFPLDPEEIISNFEQQEQKSGEE